MTEKLKGEVTGGWGGVIQDPADQQPNADSDELRHLARQVPAGGWSVNAP